MKDSHLDEFAAESEEIDRSAPRPPAASDDRQVVKIVITNEQIASSWEMFPSEAPPRTRHEDVMETLLLREEDDEYRVAAPPRRVVAKRAGRWLAAAAIVVTLAMVLFGRPGPAIETSSAPDQSVPAKPRPEVAATAVTDDEPSPGAITTKSRDVSPQPRARIETARTAGRLAPSTITTRTATKNVPPRAARATGSSVSSVTRPTPTPAPVAPVARAGDRIAGAGVPAAVASAPVTTAPLPPAPSTTAAVGATPVAAPPAAAAEARAVTTSPNPPSAVASTIAPDADRSSVLVTLHRYQEAFTNLDSNAAHAVWPSVDVRALERAFGQLDQQTVHLQGCDVGVAGNRAEASCTGTASYVPKVGNKAMRSEQRQWHFTLQQSGGQWLIDRVDAR
jgi:hypothetical protein